MDGYIENEDKIVFNIYNLRFSIDYDILTEITHGFKEHWAFDDDTKKHTIIVSSNAETKAIHIKPLITGSFEIDLKFDDILTNKLFSNFEQIIERLQEREKVKEERRKKIEEMRRLLEEGRRLHEEQIKKQEEEKHARERELTDQKLREYELELQAEELRKAHLIKLPPVATGKELQKWDDEERELRRHLLD